MLLRGTRVLAAAASLTLILGVTAACGSATSTGSSAATDTPAAATGGATTGAATTGGATTGAATAGANDTGGQYAQYYKPNGAPVAVSSSPVAIALGTMDFSPNTLTVAKGTKVTINLTNSGPIPHTFTLDAFKINVALDPGKTGTASFTPTAAGTYYFYCAVPGHAAAGMVGKITVQ